MMNVLTLNCWGHEGPAQRLPLLRKTLTSLHPEILCLQEVPDKDFLSTLASNLGSVHFLHAPESGLGILSRYPVSMHQTVTYQAQSPMENYCRQALLARLDLGARPLWIVTTHLAWRTEDEAARERQVEELLNRARPLGDSILFAGDFNAPPDAPSIQRIREAGFVDLFAHLHPDEPGITWDNQNPFIQSHSVQFPDRRIDDLFLNKEGIQQFPPLRCEVAYKVPMADGIYPSDHYGVEALFRHP